MGIQDIIKKSFLSQFNSDLSTTSVLVALVIAAAMGIYIFCVYRTVCRKAFYSKSFAISLPLIAMITASSIFAIQSNAVISLGMVGALSIVRFRTAVKDPMDLAFLFWTISVGIICGAGLHEVAVMGSLLISIVMLGLHFIPHAAPALLLLVNGTDPKVQEELEKAVKENTQTCKVKSRNVSKHRLDIIFEVKVKNEAALLDSVLALDSIVKANLLTHDGEVTY